MVRLTLTSFHYQRIVYMDNDNLNEIQFPPTLGATMGNHGEGYQSRGNQAAAAGSASQSLPETNAGWPGDPHLQLEGQAYALRGEINTGTTGYDQGPSQNVPGPPDMDLDTFNNIPPFQYTHHHQGSIARQAEDVLASDAIFQQMPVGAYQAQPPPLAGPTAYSRPPLLAPPPHPRASGWYPPGPPPPPHSGVHSAPPPHVQQHAYPQAPPPPPSGHQPATPLQVPHQREPPSPPQHPRSTAYSRPPLLAPPSHPRASGWYPPGPPPPPHSGVHSAPPPHVQQHAYPQAPPPPPSGHRPATPLQMPRQREPPSPPQHPRSKKAKNIDGQEFEVMIFQGPPQPLPEASKASTTQAGTSGRRSTKRTPRVTAPGLAASRSVPSPGSSSSMAPTAITRSSSTTAAPPSNAVAPPSTTGTAAPPSTTAAPPSTTPSSSKVTTTSRPPHSPRTASRLASGRVPRRINDILLQEDFIDDVRNVVRGDPLSELLVEANDDPWGGEPGNQASNFVTKNHPTACPLVAKHLEGVLRAIPGAFVVGTINGEAACTALCYVILAQDVRYRMPLLDLLTRIESIASSSELRPEEVVSYVQSTFCRCVHIYVVNPHAAVAWSIVLPKIRENWKTIFLQVPRSTSLLPFLTKAVVRSEEHMKTLAHIASTTGIGINVFVKHAKPQAACRPFIHPDAGSDYNTTRDCIEHMFWCANAERIAQEQPEASTTMQQLSGPPSSTIKPTSTSAPSTSAPSTSAPSASTPTTSAPSASTPSTSTPQVGPARCLINAMKAFNPGVEDIMKQVANIHGQPVESYFDTHVRQYVLNFKGESDPNSDYPEELWVTHVRTFADPFLWLCIETILWAGVELGEAGIMDIYTTLTSNHRDDEVVSMNTASGLIGAGMRMVLEYIARIAELGKFPDDVEAFINSQVRDYVSTVCSMDILKAFAIWSQDVEAQAESLYTRGRLIRLIIDVIQQYRSLPKDPKSEKLKWTTAKTLSRVPLPPYRSEWPSSHIDTIMSSDFVPFRFHR